MKYLSLVLISFSSPLLCMQPPVQGLQEIKAASLYNRIHCPLAKLPKDIQDYISEFLEFNDRESDEEFIRNTQKRTTCWTKYELGSWAHVNFKTIGFPTPKVEKKFTEFVRVHQPNFARADSPMIETRYSRDESKILITYSSPGNNLYFFVYDIRKDLECQTLSLYSQLRRLDRLLAVSNDGKYYLKSSLYVDQSKSCDIASKDQDGIVFMYVNDDASEMEFNKQSTRFIDKKDKTIYRLTTEQEHKERSKKTLALYLHQKGICKPFNYCQESA